MKMNKRRFLNWKAILAAVVVCCVLFVGVYHFVSKDGVRASYSDSDGYTYAAEDPLFAATHFHLFAQERISMEVHTHGNVACKSLNAGVDFGTRKSYFEGKKSDEISYARKLENLNPNAVAGLLILGSDYKVTSPKGANQTVVSNDKSSYTLNEISSNDIVFEKKNEHVLDLDGEFEKLKNRSKEWAKAGGCDDVKVDITSDQNNRVIDFENANMESGVTFVDIPYDDWAGMSTPITLKNLDTNNSHTGIVVLNIDLRGQKNPNLSLNEMRASGRAGSTVSINNNEVAPKSFGSVRVVYNLYDSSQKDYIYDGYVTFGGVVYGTILAPGADLSVGAINGSAIARNILHTGGESHRNDVIKERTGEDHINKETPTPKADIPKETEKPKAEEPKSSDDVKNTPSGKETPSPKPDNKETEAPKEDDKTEPTSTPGLTVPDKEDPNSGKKSTPTPEAEVKPTEKATVEPTEKSTPKPTKKPTPKPTAKVTPKPTNTPGIPVSDKEDPNLGKKSTPTPKTPTAKPAEKTTPKPTNTPGITVSDKEDPNSGNKKSTPTPEVDASTANPTDEPQSSETPSADSSDEPGNDANSSTAPKPSSDAVSSDEMNDGEDDDISSGKTSDMKGSKSEKDTINGSDSDEVIEDGLSSSKDVKTTERVKSKFSAPKTGDDMNFAAPICIMIVSFIMFVVLLVRKRSIR